MANSHFEPLARFAVALKAAAQAARQRRALIICGRPGWCRDAARVAVEAAALQRVLWIGAEAPHGTRGIPVGQARKLLGQEVDGVVYIITAGAGAPLYAAPEDGGFYHFVKVTVQGDRVTDEVVRINRNDNP